MAAREDKRFGPASNRVYADKRCEECGATFTPTAAGNLYCQEHAGKGRWERTHREQHLATRRVYMRKRRHRQNYRDADLYDKLVAANGERCAICGIEPEIGHHLRIDHDHKTGRVRGLLCEPCNIGLGWFRDSPQRLQAAAGYLSL